MYYLMEEQVKNGFAIAIYRRGKSYEALNGRRREYICNEICGNTRWGIHQLGKMTLHKLRRRAWLQF